VASLEIGIIGLPNSGKTTIFNALTGAGAPVQAFAATEVSVNTGIAPVPDERLAALAVVEGSQKLVPPTIQLVDVAGLQRGAGRDGGLSGEFLQALRAADALIHVVRTFHDDTVFHVDGRIDPVADAEGVDLELLFADGILLAKRLERLERAVQVGQKEAKAEAELLAALAAHLDAGQTARTFARTGELPAEVVLELLTLKPMLYVANTSESGDPELVDRLRGYAGDAEVVAVAGRFEAELAEIEDPGERALFLAEIGQEEASAPRVAAAAFRMLDLITFFTAGPKDVTAWTVRRGANAVEASGKIHTDIARGFIRAEVIGTDELVAAGSRAEATKLGQLRVEGKDYLVQDGDVLNVRFNV
jgi:GTP-binding protein YchF